jgi:hypothetical protein
MRGSLSTLKSPFTLLRQVNSWYTEIWWDKANIVDTDFFLSNNIISAAINSNSKRKLCRSSSSLAGGT